MTDLTIEISVENTEEIKSIQPFIDFMTEQFYKWRDERKVIENANKKEVV